MPQTPTYISYRYDSITISQVSGDSFTFTIYAITDVGGNTFTPLTFQDSSDVVQAKTVEIYRLLVTAIFKGCCECGNTEPECSIQYTAGDTGAENPGIFVDGGSAVRFNYFTANNQDFTGFWPIVQDGSWVFIFSKTDPTVYGVYQLSNYSDGGTYAQFDSTLLTGPAGFPAGTSLCVDVTSVGGSLVQDWQDTLNISSLLTQNNAVDGGGFNFGWTNVNRYTIDTIAYQVYTADDGAGSIGFVQIDPGAVTISGNAFVDIITPGYATATPGMVLALDASGHVEYTLAGTGTVTSVGLDMPSAFTVTNSPITTSGDILVTGAGTALEYINGLGELATLPVYTVENGLHTKESPADPLVFHLGGQLIEDTLIETTEGASPGPVNEWQLSVRGSADQDTRFPFGVANLGNGGVATFQDYGSGSRPNPSVEIVGDVDLLQPLLELNMEGNLPTADDTLLRLRYTGDPSLAMMTIDYQFRNNNAVVASSNFIGSRLSTEVVSFVDGNEETRFEVQLVDNGTLSNKLELQGFGQLVLNEYATSAFSNSTSNINNDLEYVLAVDTSGNVFKKLSEGGGTVTSVTATGLLTTSPNPIETTGTVTSIMDSGFLVGRYSSGTGVFEQIVIGSGLTLTGDTLSADGGGGTYDSNQGVYKDTTLTNDTFMLGAPSGLQASIAFQENRFVDLDTFTFNMEGVDPVYPGGMVNFNVSGTVGDGFVLNLDSTTGSGLRINAPVSGMEVSQKFASYFLQESDTQNNVLELWRSATTSGNASDKSARVSFAIPDPNTGIGYKQAGNIGYIASPENILAIEYGTAFVIEGYTLPSNDPNIRRVAQFEGDGQVIFNTYGIGTWLTNPASPAVYGLGVNASGSIMEVPLGGGGGTYDANEGIYKNTSLTNETFQLGYLSSGDAGTVGNMFTQDRYLNFDDFNLQIVGTPPTGISVLSVTNNSLVATLGASYAVRGGLNAGAAYNSAGIFGQGNTKGIGVLGTTNNHIQTIGSRSYGVMAGVISSNSDVADLIRTPLHVFSTRIGGGLIGHGAKTLYTLSNDNATSYDAGNIGFVSTSVTAAGNAETADFFVSIKESGSPIPVNKLEIDTLGQLKLNEYGQTPAQFPDASPVWALGVNSSGDVVEFTPTGGGGGLKSGNAIQVTDGVYEATISGVTAYTAGEAFMINFDSTNEGESTLQINTLAPINIFKNTNVKIAAGDIKAGQEIMVVYDGTNFQAIGLVTNQLLAYVHNSEAAPITKGQVVYAFGASGDRMSVKLALANADDTSAKTIGMVYDSSIAAGGEGYIIIQGVIEGINTAAFAAGATLYLSGTTPGGYTSTPTYAPTHRVYVGIVEKSNAGNGQIYVRCQNGYELDELHDVQAQSPNDNDTIYFDSADSQWKTGSVPSLSGTFSIGITVDGSGGVITAGQKGYIRIPYACTINTWSILTGNSGLGATVTFDIWRANNAIPTVANSLVGGGTKPFLTSATQQITSASPSGWTSVTLAANDILGFNVESGAAVFSWANLQLLVTKI
jgi:hypothetical protein